MSSIKRRKCIMDHEGGKGSQARDYWEKSIHRISLASQHDYEPIIQPESSLAKRASPMSLARFAPVTPFVCHTFFAWAGMGRRRAVRLRQLSAGTHGGRKKLFPITVTSNPLQLKSLQWRIGSVTDVSPGHETGRARQL